MVNPKFIDTLRDLWGMNWVNVVEDIVDNKCRLLSRVDLSTQRKNYLNFIQYARFRENLEMNAINRYKQLDQDWHHI